jgi:hypothetical protein
MSFAFDGFDKRHLPLDEVTAPYATTNFVTTMEFESSASIDQIIVVCPRTLLRQEQYAGPLTDYVAMLYDAGDPVGTPPILTSRCPIVGQPALGLHDSKHSVRARLHNMSVRLSCLGTDSGLYPPGCIFAGAVPAIETGAYSEAGANADTMKKAWAEDNMSVGIIRPFTAARLVSKPLTLDSAIAETVSYKTWRDISVPSASDDLGALSFSTALEPIVIYVPRAGKQGTILSGDTGSTAVPGTVVNYRLEIGQQWCSRHPHDIMLRSTQKQHKPTDPGTWHSAVSAVKDVGSKMLGGAASRGGEMVVDALRDLMPVLE